MWETKYSDYSDWEDRDRVTEMLKVIGEYRRMDREKESYEDKIRRLSKIYPAVAAAKAHLDELVALVEHGE